MIGSRRAAALIPLLLVSMLVPVALPAVDGADGEITVRDALEREVTLPAVPERIVIAGRAVALIANALYLFPEVSDRVVAVGATDQGLGDFFSVLDDNPGEKTRLGRSAGPEEVLARNPDLVLLKSYMRDSLGRPLETAGVPVVYLDLETPQQYARDLRILGELLGAPGRAEDIVEAFDRRRASLERAANRAAGAAGQPQVLLISVSARGNAVSFRVAPEEWIQGTQVELGGGDPVWYDRALSPGWNEVQFEQIALWDPEVIVIVSYHEPADEVRDEVIADDRWQTLSAVRNNEVYAMPADFHSYGQPDTRWILGAEWIARVLHPQLFDESFRERVFSFYREFYRMDRDDYEELVEPRLSGDLLD
ncbi:MAG: ABC transporter substrate-binding protein [Spirochaetaceae bacterium]